MDKFYVRSAVQGQILCVKGTFGQFILLKILIVFTVIALLFKKNYFPTQTSLPWMKFL